jgi:galacturan 1,4-alpha-galacturonidase
MQTQSKAEELKIAYIGGGSRGWAWGLMSDLCSEPRLNGVVRLYDIDAAAAQDNVVIGNKHSAHPDSRSKWRYEAVGSLADALSGADFVVISIMPGTLDEMASDVHTPGKYGIYHSVGDTVGPGGIVRSLRTIPMYVEFAKAIQAYCPKAWVINYTNPMTVCVRTLSAVFPEVKVFGCCHEVFGTQETLALMVEEQYGVTDVKRQDIKSNVLGINHFTWFNQASWMGHDLMPAYRNFAEKYADGFHGHNKNDPEGWKVHFTGMASRVKLDLSKRFGVIAAAGDRHMAEFCPRAWYLADPATAAQWKFRLTSVDIRRDIEAKRIAKSKRLLSGEDPIKLYRTGEEGVHQIAALMGLEELFTNVNVPNVGQMPGFPLGAVVETNAMFRGDSVRPICAGTLPESLNGLLLHHVKNQETTVRAGITRDAHLAFQAFVTDPLVTGLSLVDAESLFSEMLKNTRKYLPGWDLE